MIPAMIPVLCNAYLRESFAVSRLALFFLCESHLFVATPLLNISVIDSAEQNPRKISNLLSLYNVQQRTADL